MRPVGKFARKVLNRKAKKLKRLGNNYDGVTVEYLHTVRLAAKKLRYAGEFMASLSPKKRSKAYLSRVVAIQDTLGTPNDSVVGPHLVASLVRRGRREGLDGEDLAKAQGLITGWR